MDTNELALAFALSKGFISIDFQKKWNGFDVFIAQPSEEMLIIGYPSFILVKDGIARENSPSELFNLMEFTEVPSDFTESL